MKNARALALLFLISVFLSSLAYASPPVSSVNANIPAQNSPLSSSILRSQFAATANDINTLYTDSYVGANQILGNTVAGVAVPLTVPPCTTGLTWTNGVGLGCASSSGGITATIGDVVCSGSPTASCALANSTTARGNLGLGTASTPLFAGLSLTGLENVNLNSNSLLAALTGTVVHTANANSTVARYQLDSFGNPAHFSAVRYDGTAAAPTTIQSADVVGSFNGWGYDGTGLGAGGSYQIAATQAWTATAHGANASIWTTPNGTTTPAQQVIVGNDGGVTLGSPTGGDKGAGTLNAAGSVWSNGTQLQNGSFTAGSNMTITGSWPNLTFSSTGGGGGVSSFTGDGVIISNSASTGAVTDTLVAAVANSVLGNNTGSAASPSYTSSPVIKSIGFVTTGTPTAGTTAIYSDASGDLKMTTSAGRNDLYLSSTGSVGVNTATPAYPIDVNGGTLNLGLSITSTNTNGTSFRVNNTSSGGHAIDFTSVGQTGAVGCFSIGDETSITNPLQACGSSKIVSILQTGGLAWNTSSSFGNTTYDTVLTRISAGVVALGNTTGNSTNGAVKTAGYISAGTKFTASGCSNSATVGGATAGTITLGANTCSVTITLNGASGLTAPNGWDCEAKDLTAPTVAIGESPGSASTCVLVVPSGAGSTDIVSFHAMAY
jgi:hypothetical protein